MIKMATETVHVHNFEYEISDNVVFSVVSPAAVPGSHYGPNGNIMGLSTPTGSVHRGMLQENIK